MALLNNSFHFIAPEFRQLTAMTAEWAYFFQFCARCLPATTVRNGSFPPRPVLHTFEDECHAAREKPERRHSLHASGPAELQMEMEGKEREGPASGTGPWCL
jgi:hypothetical protein